MDQQKRQEAMDRLEAVEKELGDLDYYSMNPDPSSAQYRAALESELNWLQALLTRYMEDDRPFPIQGEGVGHDRKERTYIPWWLAEEAYAEYVRRFGNQQTLQRLADRGGFGRDELLMLLRGEDKHG